ncbi:MAG TPA: CHAT domain-containing protein [Thermoanaerobaculia bacterium]|nr:CHAT domain-containing protein [Thermoanaerobaculia bacterium]
MTTPVQILFLAANPASSTRLGLDEEFREIELNLRASEYRDRFQLSTSLAVRPGDLHQVLLEKKPTVVHFSGHGAGNPGLVFAGDSPMEEKVVTAAALQHLFSVLRDNVRVVVLNACFSEIQAQAIVEEIDFVVGMKDSIRDDAARLFAASFYRGLGFGRSVETAFNLGVSAVKLEGLVEDEDVPVLMQREGAVAAREVVLTAPLTRVPANRGASDGLALDIGSIHHANEASPDATVHVTVTATEGTIKLSELRVSVLGREVFGEVSAHVPAAPVTEHCLFGHLGPMGTGNILPTPHVLHGRETDGFLVKVHGDEGSRYRVAIEVLWKPLGDVDHVTTASPPLELLFPVRTAVGMLDLLGEE